MFFDAFVPSQKALELWTRATQEQLARVAEVTKQAEELQSQGAQRTRDAIDETARLMKASLDYAVDLGGAWRRVSMDLAAHAAAGPQAAPKG